METRKKHRKSTIRKLRFLVPLFEKEGLGEILNQPWRTIDGSTSEEKSQRFWIAITRSSFCARCCASAALKKSARNFIARPRSAAFSIFILVKKPWPWAPWRRCKPEDAIVATYREHGHALARGISGESIMAEMYGKVQGCSRGRGGSMHLFDAATRFYGGNAIVGGGLPLAVGLALADKMMGRSQVTACFFGEGAVAEGEFHESMNLAALWKLPVLFCCENNLYAMGTALSRSESEIDLCLKATAFEMPAWPVDGMDVIAVEEATRKRAACGAFRRRAAFFRVSHLSVSRPFHVRPRVLS